MKVLDRYIAGYVISGSLIALMALTALFSFIAFIDDLESVGRGDYALFDAVQFAFFTLPRRAYPLFPLAALIGTLMGLGQLAASSELVAMRAAGVSVGRLTLSVMRAGVLLVLAAMLVGEVIAPPAERYAQQHRSLALVGHGVASVGEGFWIRDGGDFVNIKRAITSERLAGVSLYEFDAKRRLTGVTKAAQADYSNGRWMLRDVHKSVISQSGIVSSHLDATPWTSTFEPSLVDVVRVKPESLSALELSRYIEFLRANELRTSRYELAIWTKLVYPLATGIMILLSVPLVLGKLRAVGIGQRILVGVLVGIAFHVTNQVSGHLGLVYGVAPWFCAVAPAALFLLSALVLFKRFD